jgi:hypothetical protein
MFLTRSCALIASLTLTSAVIAAPVIIRVDPGSPTPMQGNNWATAYHTVQEALADSRLTSEEGQHEIWVRGGTYSADALDPGNQTVSIQLVNDTMVHGGFDGTELLRPERDIDANPTVFSGVITASSRSLHVVRADNVVAEPERRFGLHGITVSGGRAIRVDQFEPFENGRGGGLWVNSSGQRLGIAACIFEDNAAGIGGGVFLDARPNPFGSPPESGGESVDRLIVSSVFRNNTAGDGEKPFTVDVDRGGGGLAILGSAEAASVLNCLFHDNLVTGTTLGGSGFEIAGGALLLLKSRPLLDHLTVMHNSAEIDAVAGGIYAGFSSTLPANGIQASIRLRNSIVYGNDRNLSVDFAAQIDADDPTPMEDIELISHSCVQAINLVVWPSANIADDPLLATPADPGNDLYELIACSPCVDAADAMVTTSPVFWDALDVDDDGLKEEATPDVQRLARVLPDGPACPPLPDMGANEFAPLPCPADLDCSQDVGFSDILAVLGAFGAGGGREDLDGSGAVDFGDILFVLSDFGACPGRGACSDSLDDLGDISECLSRYASEPEKLIACIEAVAILQGP